MKNVLKRFLVNILIVSFSFVCVGGNFHLPTILVYLVATFVILSCVQLLSAPILNFLTVKCNFITFFLINSILLVGVFYLFKEFMPDFYVYEYGFDGFNLGSIEIKSFVVVPIVSIAFVSMFASFVGAIYRELDKRGD